MAVVKWTKEQVAEIVDLRFNKCLGLREIADRFPGRTAKQVSGVIARRHERENPKSQVTKEILREGVMHRPTPGMLADRERRMNSPRTLSMERFGDPVFEQSALGKMRRGV